MRHRILLILLILPICLVATLPAQAYEGQKGDVNNDGNINVLDMLAIANHILGTVPLDGGGIWRADLNGSLGDCDGDGYVNVLDMVKIANIILENDECPTSSCETVTDIDGNVYQTVQIGDQCWMAENLKVTKYRNGDPIPNVTDDMEWGILTSGAYGDYNNDVKYVDTYGRLYNWYAVDDSHEVAPEGWHVPSDAEWKILVERLGFYSINAGGKMKSIGTIEEGTGLWHFPNTGATNESGFSGLPGGYRSDQGGRFFGLGYVAYFWSCTEYIGVYAWSRPLHYDNIQVFGYGVSKRRGFSVRCIKD